MEDDLLDLKTKCKICKKTVSGWLDLIILPDGEYLSSIDRMSEEEQCLKRESYCLECADSQVWYWLLVNVDRNGGPRLAKAQWRDRIMYNLEMNFGLGQRKVNDKLMMADYFKYCRGCNDVDAIVKTPGQPCKACRDLERCNYCGRNSKAGVTLVTTDGVHECKRCRPRLNSVLELPPVDPILPLKLMTRKRSVRTQRQSVMKSCHRLTRLRRLRRRPGILGRSVRKP
ncbi:hypothetical protein B0I37DRAFT_387019 [Chaetomium sp. MPI-CAGE-AT-0009]|nr:hypothetical protein B0I37DRAFT_387019 [Chaetomium sp. MPI-CAGE-AT-0009]